MRTKGVEYIGSHREQWFIWTTVWPHHKAYTKWTSVQDWECVCKHFMWLFMALHLPLGCIQVMSVALVFSTLGHPTVSIPTLERVTSFIPIVGVVLHSPVFWLKQSSLLFFPGYLLWLKDGHLAGSGAKVFFTGFWTRSHCLCAVSNLRECKVCSFCNLLGSLGSLVCGGSLHETRLRWEWREGARLYSAQTVPEILCYMRQLLMTFWIGMSAICYLLWTES